MFNLTKTVALGLVALSSFASPAFALRVSPLQVTTKFVRMAVSNDGKPVPVRVIGIDEQGRELSEVGAHPGRLLATKVNRTVTVRITPETHAVCATTHPGGTQKLPATGGSTLYYRVCVKANGRDDNRGHKGGLNIRLQDALK